jgi:hypothetical protein
MGKHFLQIALGTQSGLRILVEQLNQLLNMLTYSCDEVELEIAHFNVVFLHLGFRGERWRLCPNHLTQLKPVAIHEWRSAYRDLVSKHAKCPPVHCQTMTFPFNNLWSQVLRSATEGIRLIA